MMRQSFTITEVNKQGLQRWRNKVIKPLPGKKCQNRDFLLSRC